MEYKPEFTLTAEGKDITAAIRRGLMNITLTDYGGATEKSDTLQITLASETLTLPSKGARLRFGLGFNGDIKDKGWYVVSNVKSSGPPRKIVISATAAPMNSAKQDGNVISQKTRSFDDVTLGDIVRSVAGEHGLQARVTESLAGIKVTHLDQVRESDASLMSRLARQHGAVSKPANGYWLFIAQGESESASGKSLQGVTITPDQVSRWDYDEGNRDGVAAGKKKGKISVDYFNSVTGKTETMSVDHDGPDIHHPYTQSGVDAAKSCINAKKTRTQQQGRKMHLTLPGRPWLIPITAECKVETQGFGVREDHYWLVESVSFSLGGGGLSVEFSLATNIKAKKSKKEGKADVNYFG